MTQLKKRNVNNHQSAEGTICSLHVRVVLYYFYFHVQYRSGTVPVHRRQRNGTRSTGMLRYWYPVRTVPYPVEIIYFLDQVFVRIEWGSHHASLFFERSKVPVPGYGTLTWYVSQSNWQRQRTFLKGFLH